MCDEADESGTVNEITGDGQSTERGDASSDRLVCPSARVGDC